MRLTKKSRRLGNIEFKLKNDGTFQASTDKVVNNNNQEDTIVNFGGNGFMIDGELSGGKFDRKDMARRNVGTNWYMAQPTDLYWIHHVDDTDPHTQGYIGIKPEGDIDRWMGEFEDLLKYGYITSDECDQIVFEVLETGTKADISVSEIQYRRYMGVGWNYSIGGNCVNGVKGAKNQWMPWYLKAIAENPSLEVK